MRINWDFGDFEELLKYLRQNMMNTDRSWNNANDVSSIVRVNADVVLCFFMELENFGVCEASYGEDGETQYRLSWDFADYLRQLMQSGNITNVPTSKLVEFFINDDFYSQQQLIEDHNIRGDIIDEDVLPNIVRKSFVPLNKGEKALLVLAKP